MTIPSTSDVIAAAEAIAAVLLPAENREILNKI